MINLVIDILKEWIIPEKESQIEKNSIFDIYIPKTL